MQGNGFGGGKTEGKRTKDGGGKGELQVLCSAPAYVTRSVGVEAKLVATRTTRGGPVQAALATC